MSAEEKRSFLEEAGEGQATRGKIVDRLGSYGPRIFLVSVTCNALLLVVCILLSATLLRISSMETGRGCTHSSESKGLAEPYSPANAVIEYEYRSVVGNDTRFTGHPGRLWEESMHNLTAGTLIRLSEEEIEMHGSTSIPLKDGGYAGALGVAHNLHCIKKIKQYLYPDYFYPGADPNGEEMIRHRDHADHCLDWIRQGIMCYIDPSMYTMWWENPLNPTHKLPGVQKCVNWDKLHDWMMARATTKDNLVRP